MIRAIAACAAGIGILLGIPDAEPPVQTVKTEITMEEFDLMAACVMAESGGEDFETQYWVAETILNRVDSNSYPDTIQEVILDPGEFEVVAIGTIWTVKPTDSVYEAVQSALEEDSVPKDILYFTSEGYLPGTEPYRKIGNMYFSTDKEVIYEDSKSN